MIYWPAKPPGAVEDFAIDFSALLEDGETVSTPDLAITGAMKDDEGEAGGKLIIWISGGALGQPAIVTGSIVTSLGRTYFETAILPIGEEPVSLNMAKAHCRAEGTTVDDQYLLELIESARVYVEAYCGIRIAPAAVEMAFPDFGALERLSQAPVQSIVEVRYLDASGAEQLLDPSVYEFVEVSADPLRPKLRLAYGKSWPAIRAVDDAVRVSAVVGYVVVPKPIIRAMLLLIGQWFDNRSAIAVNVRGIPTELPNAVTALLANFRR